VPQVRGADNGSSSRSRKEEDRKTSAPAATQPDVKSGWGKTGLHPYSSLRPRPSTKAKPRLIQYQLPTDTIDAVSKLVGISVIAWVCEGWGLGVHYATQTPQRDGADSDEKEMDQLAKLGCGGDGQATNTHSDKWNAIWTTPKPNLPFLTNIPRHWPCNNRRLSPCLEVVCGPREQSLSASIYPKFRQHGVSSTIGYPLHFLAALVPATSLWMQ
jgi:hypothetical protein